MNSASALHAAVTTRDCHVCRCCGFRSRKHQQVLVRNGNPRDIDEMVTTCIFCHQCFNFDRVPKMRSGLLVWLPEVDQVSLHHAAREIYLARLAGGAAAAEAELAIARLCAAKPAEAGYLSRRLVARARIGTDDPAVLLGRQQARSADQVNEIEEAYRSGVRLFPLDRRITRQGSIELNEFPHIFAYWRSKAGPLGGDVTYRRMKLLVALLMTDRVH